MRGLLPEVVWLRLDDHAPKEARRLAERFFATHSRLDLIVLAVSEVVTNAYLHSDGTTSRVGLVMTGPTGGARVEVTHQGGGFDYQLIDLDTKDPADPSGRGLAIVAKIADRWGIAADGRTAVWFEVD